jgi:hypothetical protein
VPAKVKKTKKWTLSGVRERARGGEGGSHRGGIAFSAFE